MPLSSPVNAAETPAADAAETSESAQVIEFKNKPRSHVLVKYRDDSGRLVLEDDIEVPEIVFYAAR